MKNNAIINQVILISFCLIALVCSSYADVVKRSSGLPYDQLWRKADVKKYLKLPYDKKFNMRIPRVSFKKIQNLDGINGFAVVSKLEQLSPNNDSLGGILFRVCSADLSVFQVDMYNPVSCKSACDLLFKRVTFTLPLWNNIPKLFIPQYKNKTVYSILRKGTHCEKFYFDISKGVMIHVRYEASIMQLKENTPNNDLLIKQIDLIINGLTSFLDGKYEITDKQKTEYNKIREEYKIAQEKLESKRETERWERRRRRREERRLKRAREGKLPTKKTLARTKRRILKQEKKENKCKLTDTEIKKVYKYFLKKKKITLVSYSKTATFLTKIVDGLYMVVKDKKTPQQVYSQLNMSKYDISKQIWIDYTSRYKDIKSIDSLKRRIPNNMDVIIERGIKAFRPRLEDWLLFEKIIVDFDAKFPQEKSLSSLEKEKKWWAVALKKYKLNAKTYNYILNRITLSRSSSTEDKKIMREYFKNHKRDTK